MIFINRKHKKFNNPHNSGIPNHNSNYFPNPNFHGNNNFVPRGNNFLQNHPNRFNYNRNNFQRNFPPWNNFDENNYYNNRKNFNTSYQNSSNQFPHGNRNFNMMSSNLSQQKSTNNSKQNRSKTFQQISQSSPKHPHNKHQSMIKMKIPPNFSFFTLHFYENSASQPRKDQSFLFSLSNPGTYLKLNPEKSASKKPEYNQNKLDEQFKTDTKTNLKLTKSSK